MGNVSKSWSNEQKLGILLLNLEESGKLLHEIWFSAFPPVSTKQQHSVFNRLVLLLATFASAEV